MSRAIIAAGLYVERDNIAAQWLRILCIISGWYQQ